MTCPFTFAVRAVIAARKAWKLLVTQTPKTFGWGYHLNPYRVVHPMRYIRARRR